MLEFAARPRSRGIGALLIYRPDAEPGPAVEERLTPPLPKSGVSSRPAPARPRLVDGAAIRRRRTLRQLGVRPSEQRG
jgi:hypothetical protein